MAEPFTYQRSRLLILAGVVVAFVVLLYFVLTSGLFVRTVVLPRVSSAVGAVVTAEDISLSPLSSLEIRKLKEIGRAHV